MVQAEWDEKHDPEILEETNQKDNGPKPPVSLPSNEYPMVLDKTEVALARKIVLRYRGVYDYLADR